ncbi:MAG: type II secretion system F family protein [Betaproteobacteria bacterium]|nr:type II secretion system F family protein [Betaproteobacteria bacterium]
MNTDPVSLVTVVVAVVTVAAALSAGIFAYLIGSLVTEVPDEDRTYLDAVPRGFRILWPLVTILSFYLTPWIPFDARSRQHAKLRNAGAEYLLSPEQLYALRLITGLIAAVLMAWAGMMLGAFSLSAVGLGFLVGAYWPSLWIRDRIRARQKDIVRSLPFFLDIVTLCVEGGLSLAGALAQAAAKGPEGVVKVEFNRLLRDIRAGKSRAEALRAMAERMQSPAMSSTVSALIQAEALGVTLAPVLRAQADQRRTERFLRAEKLALEAPVKMLFPLIAFIFPCTFIVLGFPIAMKFVGVDM